MIYRVTARDRRTVAGLVWICAAIAACGTDPAPLKTPVIPTIEAAASHRIIVGADANHAIITEPLVEVIPPPGPDEAEIRVEFPEPDRPIMIGIEGFIAFLQGHAGDGGVVLDRKISFEGETVAMPPGEHALVVYVRTCEGSCALLDPPRTYCTFVASLDVRGRYELTVDFEDSDRATCTFVPND